MIEFILEIPLNTEITYIDNLFIQKPEIELNFQEPEYEFIAWGDPIAVNGFKENLSKNITPEFIVNNLYGHYYYLLLDKKKGYLFAGNSMFSILPVYYYKDAEKIFLSGNAFKAGQYLQINKISNRFILETLLFNYPLFNNSIFEKVNLLPSNSYFNVSGGGVKIVKHTHIEQYFTLNPSPWKKSVEMMTEVFLETVKKYLPDEQYAHSLTGGFDGRTLVAAGLFYRKNFISYCFGNELSKDLFIASKVAESAGIQFSGICLDEKYIEGHSLGNGLEFINNSSATATFARAHYLYAVKKLAENFGFIVTGNCGSEIFRAARIQGVVISSNLYKVFKEDNYEQGLKNIEQSKELEFLIRNVFRNEFEELKNDISELPCYNRKYSGLSKNERFYVFAFEELNRKYFGAEMVNQFRYLKNRTPFLDIDFLKALFGTELAGIHSEFFEHNPFRRYKGQVLYANIIRKAYPALGKIKTDKGHSPDDLINVIGKMNIVSGYLKKILNKSHQPSDPYSVGKAWEYNKNFWMNVQIPGELFDLKKINENTTPREVLFKIISLSYIINDLPRRRKD